MVLVGAPLCWGRAAPAQELPELRLPQGRQVKLQLVDSSVALGRLVETLPDRVVVRTLVGAGKPFSHYRNRDVAVDPSRAPGCTAAPGGVRAP